MKKNELYTITVTGMTAEGNGVGRTEDGMAVFVPLTAVGDVISCKIVKVAKSYAYGIIDKIISPSDDRTESSCPVSSKCGGCTFRHISYEAELKIKDGFVRDAFERIGGFRDVKFEEICGCESPDRYRNKAQYPLAEMDGKAVCGFYSKRSHRVVPFTDCMLQPDIFSHIATRCTELINEMKLKAYNEENGEGIMRHIYIRRGFHSGEIMVCFVVKSDVRRQIAAIADKLTKEFDGIKSVVMNINPKNTNVILGNKNVTIWGKDFICDTLCGNKTELSPMSFYQVNTAQAEKLYECAKDYAELTGNETLLDLYCGAGTIGLSMAGNVKKVIGCEIVPEAIENAKKNAAANGYDNAEFFCGDAGEFAAKLAESGINPDAAVIDPPRKGCDTLTLDSLVKMSPKRIVMISCNPATAARDAKYLCENGYTLVKVRAFDLFGRTGHVETVVLMSRVKE
jgi:23S rRNA (uracil1939-C5)-methyltransferase